MLIFKERGISMERKKYEVTCCNCGYKFVNLWIGINSYIEFICPHCLKRIFIKSSSKGLQIKTI